MYDIIAYIVRYHGGITDIEYSTWLILSIPELLVDLTLSV